MTNSNNSRDDKYRGISGWLLFFVIILALNIVLSLFFINDYYDGIYVIIGVLVFISFLYKLEISQDLIIIWLWLGVLLDLKNYLLYQQGSKTLIFAIIWTIYFVRSKRVKQTLTKNWKEEFSIGKNE